MLSVSIKEKLSYAVQVNNIWSISSIISLLLLTSLAKQNTPSQFNFSTRESLCAFVQGEGDS